MELTLSHAALFFLLAALLPTVVFLPLRAVLRKTVFAAGDETENLAGILSLLVTCGIVLPLIDMDFGSKAFIQLWPTIALAALLGAVETRLRLPTQFTIPIRILLATLAYIQGFAFHPGDHLSWQSSLKEVLIDYPVTVAFFLGVMMSVEVLDRLRGLASGVIMIMAFSLLVLMLHWSFGPALLLMLMVAGLASGHLFLLSSGKKIRLGTSGQLVMSLLLAEVTISSRTWTLTLGILFIAIIAIGLPMIDSIFTVIYRLGHGSQRDGKSHLKSMLLNIGFTERFLVYTLWFVTLLIGVVVNAVYEAESLALAIGMAATILAAAIFMVAVLMRVGERMERNRHPESLRIVFLSHYFSPEVNAPASRLHEHARRWVQNGHHVTVICPVPSAPHGWPYVGYRNAWWNEEVIDGIRVIRVWTFIAANKGRVRRTLNYVSFMMSSLIALLFVRRHDAMIATTPQFFCGFAGALASLFRHEPFILEVRDLWPESIEAVGAARSGIALTTIRFMARWMYSRASQIVTVGEGYRARLIAQGSAPATKISVVSNGVDFGVFDECTVSRETARRQFNFHDRFVVSYVGTIGLAHGLDVVLRAAERDKDDRTLFVLCGDGAERKRLETAVQEKRLGNVIFTGLLPKKDIPALIHASDACLVHLKDQELFSSVMPSKMFEAMAMKRPVILGLRGFAKMLLEDAGAGIAITPENDEELYKAALQLSNDPLAAAAAGENGWRYAAENFSRTALADRYIVLLREVSSRKTGLTMASAAEMQAQPLVGENPEMRDRPTP